jgi:pyridoxamine 5'-phosphate oxidase-like protein
VEVGRRAGDEVAQLLGRDYIARRQAALRAGVGIWLDGAFYFSSGAKSRKARNLAANPNCVVCPEDGIHAVSLEGVAGKITEVKTIRKFVAAYNRKYNWDLKPETVLDMGPIFAVRPRKVIAVDASPGKFQSSATRWLFEEGRT